MTILETLAMRRDVSERVRRRHLFYSRVVGFFPPLVLIVTLAWCYASRVELARIITSVLNR